MAAALVILFVVVGAPLLLWLGAKQTAKRTAMLQAALAGLGRGTVIDAEGMDVNHLGVDVSFRLTHRGSGKNRTSWTYVTAAMPRGYPCALHVQAHGWFDDGKIARGEMVDLVVGDDEFDRRFRVEAAPAGVITRVLDADARALLLRLSGTELETIGSEVRLASSGWAGESAEVIAQVAFLARLVAGVREAHATLDDAVVLPDDGGVYRAIPDDRPLQAARTARAAEVAELEAKRAARPAIGIVGLIIIVVAVVVAFMALMAD